MATRINNAATRRVRPSRSTMCWLVRAAVAAETRGELDEADRDNLTIVVRWLDRADRPGAAEIHAAVLHLHRRFALDLDHGKRPMRAWRGR